MALGESAGLLFKISGDNADGLKALNETKAGANELTAATGSLAQGFSGLINPATLATAAFTAGTVALTATVAAAIQATQALFDAAKNASDFGSEIFDASQKTGLGAESLSALKYAAEQAGSSFEQVTKGVTVFGITLGEANAGNDKAQEKLKALGVTATDLDGALEQVFKTIGNAKTPTDQLALATEAFGKKIGPDLIPLIKDANGNFTELIKKAKDLGVTINDDAMIAADEFGDALDTLNTQFGGLGRQIGFIFMPIFTDAMEAMSRHLAANQQNIDAWANTARMQLLGVQQALSIFEDRLEEFRQRTGKTWIDIANDLLEKTGPMIGRLEQIQKLLGGGVAAEGLGRVGPGRPAEAAAIGSATLTSGSGTGSGGGRRSGGSDNAARTAEAAERKRISDIRKNLADELALRSAVDAKKQAEIELQLAKEEISTQQSFERIQDLVWASMQFKIDAYEATLAAVQGNAEEEERLNRELKVMWQEFHTLSIEQAKEKIAFDKAEIAEQEKKAKQAAEEHKKNIDRWNERIQKMHEVFDLQREADAEKARQEALEVRRSIEGNDVTGLGTLGGGIAAGLGIDLAPMFDSLTGQMITFQDRLGMVKADLNDFVGNAIGGMVEGLAQMGAAWLATGEFSAQAALSMIASAALSIAAQAGFKAIFEVAEGIKESALAAASAAIGDARGAALHTAAAAMHYTAAKTYGVVAAIAGGAGVVAGLGARAAGSGGSKAFSAAVGSATGSDREEPSAIRRQSDNAFTSGPFAQSFVRMEQRMGEMLQEQRQTTRVLGNFESMPAGEVLVKGADQNKGFFAKRTVSELERDSGSANRLVRTTRI